MVIIVIFGLVWFCMVWFGLVLYGLVCGYCQNEFLVKFWSLYVEKWLSCGHYSDIWFGLVLYGLVWFGLVLYGLVCGYCQNKFLVKIWRLYVEKWLSYGTLPQCCSSRQSVSDEPMYRAAIAAKNMMMICKILKAPEENFILLFVLYQYIIITALLIM